MRKLLGTIVLLLASSGGGADERILSYDSRIEVHSDSSLEVTERILVRAEGNKIRRGIFREFPTTYSRPDGTKVTVGFDVMSVRRNGVDEPYHTQRRVGVTPYHTQRRSNGVAVYVGRKDYLLPAGPYSYEIRYRTDRQLGFFADHDELYWNVTGVDWDFPIDSVTAQVTLPAGVPADAVRLEGYTGPMGATWKHYRAQFQDGRPVFETTKPLGPQQGLTIVVAWPKGYVEEPGELARLGYFLRDNRPLTYCALGLIALLGYYVFVWNRVGRDPPRGVVIPRYRPPERESPASMRYLLEMGYDNRCLVAGILSLAVKGYLVIEQDAGGLFRNGKYTLRRDHDSQTPLSPDEQALLRALFDTADSLELDDQNHAVLRRAMSLARGGATAQVPQPLLPAQHRLALARRRPQSCAHRCRDRLAGSPGRLRHRVVPGDPGGLGDRSGRPDCAVRGQHYIRALVAGTDSGRSQADGRDRGLPTLPVGGRRRRARAGGRAAQDTRPIRNLPAVRACAGRVAGVVRAVRNVVSHARRGLFAELVPRRPLRHE